MMLNSLNNLAGKISPNGSLGIKTESICITSTGGNQLIESENECVEYILYY